MYCKELREPTLFDNITNRFILPSELMIGCIFQVINYLILRKRSLVKLRHNKLLRLQSLVYLINILVLVPAILRKNGLVRAEHNSSLTFYYAHIEKASINFFIIYGNFITMYLAFKAMHALIYPIQPIGLAQNSTKKWKNMLVFGIISGVFVGVIVLPVCFMKKFTVHNTLNGTNGPQPQSDVTYCIQRIENPWLEGVRYVGAVSYELGAIVVIFIAYFWLLFKYVTIQRSSENQTSAAATARVSVQIMHLVGEKHLKATALCLGSIMAFLICNLSSGVLELVYLVAILAGWMPAFKSSSVTNVWQNTANIMLVFNFTFTFFVQMLNSGLYRRGFRTLFRRRVEYSSTWV